MRLAIFGAGVVLALVVAGAGEGQTKQKKLPALAFDAKFVKFEQKKGVPTKVYYVAEDGKKLGFTNGDTPITSNTKFVFVGPDGEKTITLKALLKDERVMKYLQPDSKI